MPRAAGPDPPPSPAPPAAGSQWGTVHRPAQRPAASGGESENRVLRGFWRKRSALRGHASRRGPAREANGGGARKVNLGCAGVSPAAAGRDRGATGRRLRQVRGPCHPAASAYPTPSPARPHACTGPEHAPEAGRRPNRSAHIRAPRPGRPAQGAPGRVREDQPGMERAHWRGRGQVRARSMRSVKAQSATWEPGACSVRARTPRTRRRSRSPQPAGGEKKEERNHLRVTSGKAAFCEEAVASHRAPQFS